MDEVTRRQMETPAHADCAKNVYTGAPKKAALPMPSIKNADTTKNSTERAALASSAIAEMEGRKRMDCQDIKANCIRYDRIEDNPTIDLMDAHQEERRLGRRVQDWYDSDC